MTATIPAWAYRDRQVFAVVSIRHSLDPAGGLIDHLSSTEIGHDPDVVGYGADVIADYLPANLPA